jgi:hypothetical protein
MREQGATISHAVRQYLDLMATKRTRSVLAPLHEIDFDREVPAFIAWMERSLTYGAMPDAVAGVWFYVPEIMMNEPKVHFVGSKGFSFEDADWASATDWTQDATGRRARATPSDHPAEFDSAVLRAVLAAIGCDDESDESPFEQDEQLGEEMFFTTTGLAQVYVGCLLHVAMPKIAPSLACGGRAWRGVGYGLASGDLQYAGVLGARGWLDKTRAKRVTAKEPDGEFYRLLSTWKWNVASLFEGARVDFPEADDYDAIRGVRSPRTSPLPALPPVRTIAMRSETPRATTDFAHSFSTPPVVTSRFREVLEAFNSQIVWYPVELTHKGKPVEGEYWVMAIRPALSFHDEAASKRAGKETDEFGPEMLLSHVVDPSKVPADVDIFSHFESPDDLYVRGHVLKELRRRKIKGIEASKLRVLGRDNPTYDASRPASRPFGLLTASEPEANHLRTDVNPTSSHPEREFFTISNWQWRVHCLHHADLPTLEAIRGFRPFAGNTPPPPLPMPRQFCLESNSREPHGDFATSSLVPPVVSARFRQVLDSFTREIMWYPVDLMHNGLKLDGEFWAMAIRPLLSFHNEADTRRAGPKATDLLLGIVIDPEKVPQHLNVFAHVERPEQLFVSDAVVEALRSSGVTGFEATPVRVINNSRSNR